MGGCECAALDDTAHSFRFGKMPSIWPSWPVFCCWAPWARFFMVEIVYLGSYNVFTCNTPVFYASGAQFLTEKQVYYNRYHVSTCNIKYFTSLGT